MVEQSMPRKKEDTEEAIGFLHHRTGERGFRVVGNCCASKVKHTNSPLYPINIKPYRATCCECNTVLIEGGKGWPELFNGQH